MRKTRENFVQSALEKMAEIAGYDYNGCLESDPDEPYKKKWRFELTWTEAKRLEFKKWWFENYIPKRTSQKLKEIDYGYFDLMWGFTVSDRV